MQLLYFHCWYQVHDGCWLSWCSYLLFFRVLCLSTTRKNVLKEWACLVCSLGDLMSHVRRDLWFHCWYQVDDSFWLCWCSGSISESNQKKCAKRMIISHVLTASCSTIGSYIGVLRGHGSTYWWLPEDCSGRSGLKLCEILSFKYISLVRVMDNILCPELHISLRWRFLTTPYEKLSQRLEVFWCGNLTICWWCFPDYVVRQAMSAPVLYLDIKDRPTWSQCIRGKRWPLHFSKNKSTRDDIRVAGRSVVGSGIPSLSPAHPSPAEQPRSGTALSLDTITWLRHMVHHRCDAIFVARML